LFLDVPLLDEQETLDATLTLEIPVDETTQTTKELPLTFAIVDEKSPRGEFPFSGSTLVIILVIALLLMIGVYVYIYIKKQHDKKD
jgi:hypothetical protein